MYEVYERLLKEKGVRTADVCKTTGLRQSMFSDWKSGKYQPKTDKLQLIADYFDVPLETFTGKRKRITAVFHKRNSDFEQLSPVSKTAARPPVQPKKITLNTSEIARCITELMEREIEENPDQFLIDNAPYEMPWEEVALLEQYRAADPGTKAAVRKLLDIPDEEPEDDLMPIAAHAHDGATQEELEEDMRIAESDD